MNALLEAAKTRALGGACVVPLWSTDASGVCKCPKRTECPSPGKHPRTMRGLLEASADPTTLDRWWEQWPDANVGVRTDDEPRIDIDLIEVADAVLAAFPELPQITEVVRTRKRGLHIAIRCAGVPTQKLLLEDGRAFGDLKAVGGYVLVPPSRVGASHYELLSPPGVRPIEVADSIAWLRDTLAGCGHTLRHTPQKAAFRDVGAMVGEGGRHAAITSHAGWMWTEGISPEAFRAALQAVNRAICTPPLAEQEVDDIARYFIERKQQRTPSPSITEPSPNTVQRLESLDEWLNGDDAPLDVVVGDGSDGAILPIDGKGFVAGSTGIGKTNLLLRLGRCLAEAAPFLGFPVPQPRRVLHVALEGSRRGLRRRLKKVWAAASADVKARYQIVLTQLNLATDDGADELERLIAEAGAEVVIIDPLRNAHTWDENSSQEMAQLTGLLDAIIVRNRCALIGAHHDRKKPPLTKRDSGTDRIRGSTALAGWLSFCLSIEKDAKVPDRLNAEWTKVRDAEDGLSDLTLDFDRETINYSASERKAASKVSDDDILTQVFHAGPDGIRGTELVPIVAQATGAGERTVKDRIRDLVKDDRLIEFVADEDQAKRAKSYRLPDFDEEDA
ncbi:MAG: AAA family ATPase [Dehalococcoidia bacterium]